MHVSLLVLIDPAPFDDLTSAVDELALLVESLSSRPHLPVAVHVPGRLLEHVIDTRPELAQALPGLNVEWIRTGWGEPDFGSIPEPVAQMAFAEEAAAFERLGLTPGAAFIRHRWVDTLPMVLSQAEVPAVLLARSLVDSAAPGVVVSFDRVIPAAAVSAPSPIDELAVGDGQIVWAILTSELEQVAARVQRAGGHALAHPSECLSSHRVSGRLQPHLSRFHTPSPEIDLLWRKSVRLGTRLGERPDARAVRLVLDAVHTTYLTESSQPWERQRAHAALVRARAILDAERRRGDEWGRVTRLDWDADGDEEVQIELPELSLVIDPADSARLLGLDDKKEGWTVGYVPGVEPGSLCRIEGAHPFFTLDRVEEGKGDVTLQLSSPGIVCRMVAGDRRLALSYETKEASGLRFGPELVLSVGEARVRVDGGEWLRVAAETTLTGHRFRIEGGGRQVLFVAMMPTELHLSPVAGGVVAWPSWPAGAGAKHDVTVDLAP